MLHERDDEALILISFVTALIQIQIFCSFFSTVRADSIH